MKRRTDSKSVRSRRSTLVVAVVALLGVALVACRGAPEGENDGGEVREPAGECVEEVAPAAHRAEPVVQSVTEKHEYAVAIDEVVVDAEVIEDSAEEEPVLSDKPQLSKEVRALIGIGIGGGAGGRYGGRCAGRQRSSARGSAACSIRLGPPDTEAYVAADEGGFRRVADAPLSTFSIDVDTASYTNVRRFLREGRLPPPDAVRVEELLNYFRYDYAGPAGERPFAVHVETSTCPWATGHRLVRVGLQTERIAREERGPANLVFLIDVSGSMRSDKKLPLVKHGLALLVRQLDKRDRVAIVTYAGDARVVLASTVGTEQDTILAAIESLVSGGSTNGAAGILDAYEIAEAQHEPGTASRVILATDGDFNVGVTSRDELVRLIEEQARGGVFLTVLGFGTGNIKDARLEQLADRGNGHYAYVDSHREARRVFVDGLTGTLETVAKDVKVQVEFNPNEVHSYRLVGYANRRLANRDFNDDTKDAGEIGAGHSVTALYEVVPAGFGLGVGVDPLKYQAQPVEASAAAESGELLTIKVRWKAPDADLSERYELAVRDGGAKLEESSDGFRFAAAVASFGMLLSDSEHAGEATLSSVLALASSSVSADPGGERTESLDLVALARELGGE